MKKKSSPANKTFQLVIACLGWFALIAQFYIMTGNRVTSIPEMVTRFFSFFTISTNILVAICFTVLLFSPNSKWGNFFGRQQTMAAITVYIIIVGLIYNTILRFLWAPVGLQKLVDELLHTVIPLLCVIYWMLFVEKAALQWKNVWSWLLYPLVYIIYTLIRGPIADFYPYPFVDVRELGWAKVLLNAVGIAVLFAGLSLVVIAIGKAVNKKSL